MVQLASEPDIQALIGNAYQSDLSGPEVSCSTAQNTAIQYLNRLVFRDNPQPGQDLQTVNLVASVLELIRQMAASGNTVLRMTVAATSGATFANPASGVTAGNPVIITSLKRPSDGAYLENAYAEPLQVTCTSDSFTGNATAYNEPFSITGENALSDVFAWNWPQGSGCSFQVNAIDGQTSNGSGNLLTNSSFETFTNNVPNNWVLAVGTAGTNIAKETTLVYVGMGCLKIIGDGSSTLTSLTQVFGSSSGSSDSLTAASQYSVNLFLRRGGSVVTQGVLQVDLIDSNNAILNDDAGVANSFTIDLTTLTTSYVAFNGVFRTPYNLPSTVYLRLHLTTSLANNIPVYVDDLSLGLMTQAYTSGPFVAIHSGSVASVVNDYNKITVTNSRGSGGTLSTFQTLFNQFFGMQGLDLLLPSAASPSISDALITS